LTTTPRSWWLIFAIVRLKLFRELDKANALRLGGISIVSGKTLWRWKNPVTPW
jgi:hypothetical protein